MCVSRLALGILRAKGMCHIITPSVDCLELPFLFFPHHVTNGRVSEKKN